MRENEDFDDEFAEGSFFAPRSGGNFLPELPRLLPIPNTIRVTETEVMLDALVIPFPFSGRSVNWIMAMFTHWMEMDESGETRRWLFGALEMMEKRNREKVESLRNPPF